MTKKQFLDKLRTALSGKVSSELVAENLRYYEDYINTEVRKGKTEEEVLEGLGDPRLIARTIAETKGGSGSWSEEAPEGGNGSYREEDEDGYHIHRQAGGMGPGLFFRLPLWAWLIIVLVVIIVILSVIFSVIAAVLPILLPILLVLLLIKLFRDWMN